MYCVSIYIGDFIIVLTCELLAICWETCITLVNCVTVFEIGCVFYKCPTYVWGLCSLMDLLCFIIYLSNS